MIGSHPAAGLGLDGTIDVFDHEVDLDAGAQSPIEEVGVAGAVGVVAAQLVEHQFSNALRQLAADLDAAPLGKEVDHPDIEEEEFR